MTTVKRKSTVPYYACAGVWVLYAALFPLYKPGHYVLVLLASALVFGLFKAYRTLRPLMVSATVAEQRAAYENSVEDFERAKGQLQDNVDEQQARLKSS